MSSASLSRKRLSGPLVTDSVHLGEGSSLVEIMLVQTLGYCFTMRGQVFLSSSPYRTESINFFKYCLCWALKLSTLLLDYCPVGTFHPPCVEPLILAAVDPNQMTQERLLPVKTIKRNKCALIMWNSRLHSPDVIHTLSSTF